MRVNLHVYVVLGICRAVRYELWKTHGGHRQSVALFFPPTVGLAKAWPEPGLAQPSSPRQPGQEGVGFTKQNPCVFARGV